MPKLAAVVLAAGLGTRMKSERPKVMHHVLGRPMLFYAVDVALGAGADLVAVVVGYGREQLQEALDQARGDAPIRYAVQAEQRGTGHAVLCAVDAVRDGFDEVLVLNGDLPHLRAQTVDRLVRETRRAGSPLGFLTTRLGDLRGYGRVVRDGSGRAVRIVEERDADEQERSIDEVNVGTYLFEAGFLLEEIGSLTTDNVQAEFYLTDLVERAARRGRHALAVLVDDPIEVSGVNSRAELAKAEAHARRLRNHALMLEGVTMIDPERTIVEADVELARDVTLWPGVILQGRTRVGPNTEIEVGCVVRDSTLAAGVRLFPYSHLDGAEIGPGAQIGPFARLRPGTVLAEKAKLGNFVEVKKSRIGEGSKANHLTYIGDAEIGRGVNVGAGTITCNYDGHRKYRTVLGDGVFVGSDVQFIAPVTVGAEAHIGAGTTVTEDVPPGALAISRAPHKIIEGYAERKKKKWAAQDAREAAKREK